MSVRVSRATFLKVWGTALIGAGLDVGKLVELAPVHTDEAESNRRGSALLLQNATAALFLPHVNSSFAVRSVEGNRERFVLAEVAERPVSKNVKQFSLIFHAPAGAAFRDGTHTFAHPALGNFSLFIVPVGGPNPRRAVYQACFSRHLSPREAQGADRAQTA